LYRDGVTRDADLIDEACVIGAACLTMYAPRGWPGNHWTEADGTPRFCGVADSPHGLFSAGYLHFVAMQNDGVEAPLGGTGTAADRRAILASGGPAPPELEDAGGVARGGAAASSRRAPAAPAPEEEDKYKKKQKELRDFRFSVRAWIRAKRVLKDSYKFVKVLAIHMIYMAHGLWVAGAAWERGEQKKKWIFRPSRMQRRQLMMGRQGRGGRTASSRHMTALVKTSISSLRRS
jgi:hypothetical protein